MAAPRTTQASYSAGFSDKPRLHYVLGPLVPETRSGKAGKVSAGSARTAWSSRGAGSAPRPCPRGSRPSGGGKRRLRRPARPSPHRPVSDRRAGRAVGGVLGTQRDASVDDRDGDIRKLHRPGRPAFHTRSSGSRAARLKEQEPPRCARPGLFLPLPARFWRALAPLLLTRKYTSRPRKRPLSPPPTPRGARARGSIQISRDTPPSPSPVSECANERGGGRSRRKHCRRHYPLFLCRTNLGVLPSPACVRPVGNWGDLGLGILRAQAGI